MAHQEDYDIGELVEITVEFRNSAGTLADPTAITFLERDPTGTVVTRSEVDATNPSVGVWKWEASKPFDREGLWRWRAEATAGLQTAVERAVRVRPSLFH